MFRITPAVRAAIKANTLKKRYRPGSVNWRRAIALRNRLIDGMDVVEQNTLSVLTQRGYSVPVDGRPMKWSPR